MKDEVYRQKQAEVGAFEFNDNVANVFDDMISRSVPGYGLMLSMIELLAQRFVVANSNLYDLGCSLGAGTLRIQRQTPASCTIHAVDNSPAMINRLQNKLAFQKASEGASLGTSAPRMGDVILHQCDVRHVPIQQACFVALNLTLQFLPVEDRSQIIQNIFQGMLPGGALLLSEKINFDDGRQQNLLTDLHHDFKRANGYSDLEIAQKRTALENTLITETLDAHCARLKTAGFRLVVPWLQCFNFVSILAVKDTDDNLG